MTETELNDYYLRKKKEVVERFLGTENKYPIPDPIEHRFFSPITESGKSYYGKSMGKPMNPSAFDPWLHEFNEKMHTCNGKIVTYVESGLDAEVPPPVK